MNAQLMRLDRARWNRVHTAITVALGIGWMLAALTLLAAFWLIGAIATIPWYFRGVEGRGRSLEALVR